MKKQADMDINDFFQIIDLDEKTATGQPKHSVEFADNGDILIHTIDDSATGMTKEQFVNQSFSEFDALMSLPNKFTMMERYSFAWDWYTNYFAQTFQTFTRREAGLRISPSDKVMSAGLSFLHIAAPCLPRQKRPECFDAFATLLQTIADKWDDAAAPALNAKHHILELENIVMVKTDVTYQLRVNGETARDPDKSKWVGHVFAEYAEERRELKKVLDDISAQLLKANKSECEDRLGQMEANICAVVSGEAKETRDAIGAAEKIATKKIVKAEMLRAHKRGKEKMDAAAIREVQLEKAAEWVKTEYREGRQYSFDEAAAAFISARPELFEAKGGYAGVGDNATRNFGMALRRHAGADNSSGHASVDELGISDIIRRDEKRGRKRKLAKIYYAKEYAAKLEPHGRKRDGCKRGRPPKGIAKPSK